MFSTDNVHYAEPSSIQVFQPFQERLSPKK
jgi:hypothetical protein